MASALSDDEFQRMQAQLLELRTSNYDLDNKCRKYYHDLVTLQEKSSALERELQKANRTISKSKKTKEFDALISENESLSHKLQSQEDDFRLQNDTLLQELSRLVDQNEVLEKQLANVGSGGDSAAQHNEENAQLQSEVRRIQAENEALRKNFTEAEEKLKSSICDLQEKVRVLSEINCKLESKCSQLQSESGEDDNLAKETSAEELEASENTDGNTSLLDLVTQSDEKIAKLELQLQECSELSLQLETERAENRILKESIQTLEKQYKDQVTSLEDEVAKVTDKLRKKQESLVQLQEEKEKLYTTNKDQYENLQTSKQREIQSLQEQLENTQTTVTELTQSVEQLKQAAAASEDKFNDAVSTLEEQMTNSFAQSIQQLEDDKTRQQVAAAELESKLKHAHNTLAAVQNRVEELEKEKSSLNEKLEEVEEERDGLNKMYAELNKVAEKRKALLDDLAIRLQQTSDEHAELMNKTKRQHEEQINTLQASLTSERVKTSELNKSKEKLEEAQALVRSLESSKSWLERRLEEEEATSIQQREEASISAQQAEHKHVEAIAKLTLEHEMTLQDLSQRIEKQQGDIDEQKKTIIGLKQQIKDGLEERKIHERKGAQMVKDLKRQLHGERKRAEKLQEKLQEFLSDSQHNRGSVEELFQPVEPASRIKNDASSVSSWSMLSGSHGTERSPRDERTSPSRETPPFQLEDENAELMKRVATLQQENADLNERVAHLEMSSSAMAEDVLQKTLIIEHYITGSRIDQVQRSPSHQEKMGLNRFKHSVVDFVTNRSDENQKELNKKLQHMLEETLTKNIYLQQDVESLSQQLMEMNKSSSQTSTPDQPTA